MKPKTQQILGKEHLCFTISQSKVIASTLSLKKSNDSLIFLYRENQKRLNQLAQKKDTTVYFLLLKQEGLKEIINQKNKVVLERETELQLQQKKQFRSAFLNKVLSVGLITLTGILIIK